MIQQRKQHSGAEQLATGRRWLVGKVAVSNLNDEYDLQAPRLASAVL